MPRKQSKPKQAGDSSTLLGWRTAQSLVPNNPLFGVYVTEAEVPKDLETKQDRSLYIADLMFEMRWETGKSAPVLAKVWGCATNTVEHYSALASLIVKSHVQDGEGTTRDVCVGLMHLFRSAVQQGDARSAATLAREWAVIVGAKAPQRTLRLNATLSAEQVDPKAAALALQETAKSAALSAFKKTPYVLTEGTADDVTDVPEPVPEGVTRQ